ncbi:GNAT family N-acetyltransferase [Paracraurococcus ruber]|uniref:N-acetyltransferase domain-containing protein n=1 Tax=Paracraurococcus ruber TaxID=77675 RepID=A0ABS1D2D6_9PROT|nr:GNAT family N-acetyltransferase [Paracraurococcus ruber]MBK1661001.1 hypothetical protein [Paracraurococcus ruber]TDG32617.1 GNAT family N-acetyltransferase [Paracraurococcus ruber]
MLRIEPTADDALLVEHYRLHWHEMGVAEDAARADWQAEARRFLREARARDGLAAFAARDAAGAVIGTACCHLMPRAFPAFRQGDADRIGYVWGLYVRPGARGRGVGGALVGRCVSHLKGLGCGRVLLHAGARSAPLYRRLGFSPTHELAMPL